MSKIKSLLGKFKQHQKSLMLCTLEMFILEQMLKVNTVSFMREKDFPISPADTVDKFNQ